MDITLFELHLPDAEFNAPFAGRSPTTEPEPNETADADDTPASDAEPSARLGPLAVLLGAAGLALLARYLRGGEAEQSTLDEVEA